MIIEPTDDAYMRLLVVYVNCRVTVYTAMILNSGPCFNPNHTLTLT